MARRNKKLMKLRAYRDKLIADNVNLQSRIREDEMRFFSVRKALSKDDALRAYAIASSDIKDSDAPPLEFIEKNEAIAELTLVYKLLSIERNYTHEMITAVRLRDLLRIAALTADHIAEADAHDKMLSTWSKDHGFTKSFRDQIENN